MRPSFAVLVSLCACSAGVTPGDGGTGGSGAGGGGGTAAMCTFTGAKTGSVPCAFVDATYTASANKTVLNVHSAAGAATTVAVQFSIESTPGPNNYSGGISSTECTLDVTEGGMHWGASSVMTLGACALTLRTVRQLTDVSGVRTYDLHGGFSASVEPDTGSGTVTVQGSF